MARKIGGHAHRAAHKKTQVAPFTVLPENIFGYKRRGRERGIYGMEEGRKKREMEGKKEKKKG